MPRYIEDRLDDVEGQLNSLERRLREVGNAALEKDVALLSEIVRRLINVQEQRTRSELNALLKARLKRNLKKAKPVKRKNSKTV